MISKGETRQRRLEKKETVRVGLCESVANLLSALSLLASQLPGLQAVCYQLSALSFLALLSHLPTFSPSQLLFLASQPPASQLLCPYAR